MEFSNDNKRLINEELTIKKSFLSITHKGFKKLIIQIHRWVSSLFNESW